MTSCGAVLGTVLPIRIYGESSGGGAAPSNMNEIQKLIAEWDLLLEMLRVELQASSTAKRKERLTRHIDTALDERSRLSKTMAGVN